jgi:hypothetical protein
MFLRYHKNMHNKTYIVLLVVLVVVGIIGIGYGAYSFGRRSAVITLSETNSPVPETDEKGLPTEESTTYSQYQLISGNCFLRSPYFYNWEKIKIDGLFVTDFLEAGGRGGSSNYIQALNTKGPVEEIMINIPSNSDYQSIVSQLHKGDALLVYGIGMPSQSFATDGVDITTYPVLKATGLTSCGSVEIYSCTDALGINIFGEER